MNSFWWTMQSNLCNDDHDHITKDVVQSMVLLADTQNWWLRMRLECRERFRRHCGLAIPTCIKARACRMHRDACEGLLNNGFFEIGCGEDAPGIPCACATHNFAYLVRGPWHDTRVYSSETCSCVSVCTCVCVSFVTHFHLSRVMMISQK